MKKSLIFAAVMAGLLASCQNDELAQVPSSGKSSQAGIENAVAFDAYAQRSVNTRAGSVGELDNTKLGTDGFGVFGYYTDNNEYDETYAPKYLYNEKIYQNGGSWTYDNTVYWPDEYGSDAQSEDVDKSSFFAYAPYVDNIPSTGKVDEDASGITGFSRNTAAGDPYVKYIASLDPAERVDLCWGVVPDEEAYTSWSVIQGNGTQEMAAGFPWLNVQHPAKSTGQPMKFLFKHALAQLNVQIDADVNADNHDDGGEVASNTKVFVRSIKFMGFALKGALNLNNETAGVPNWKTYNCSNEIQGEEITIYDGMKDGGEGTGYTASNEKMTGLNPTIIQSKAWAEQAATDGVQHTAKNLFASDTPTEPIYVIPTTDEMTVTICYDIETADSKLGKKLSDGVTPGISIPNTISKTITFSGDGSSVSLEAGKKYTINIHIGLNTIDIIGEVSEWEDADDNGEAWVPAVGPIPDLFRATSADVGKWVDRDGNFVDSRDDAAGWIAYATDDHRGLLLAMEPSATEVDWETAMATDLSSLPYIRGTRGVWHIPSANYLTGDKEWDLMEAGIKANAATCPLFYVDYTGYYWRLDKRYWSSTEIENTSVYYFNVDVRKIGNQFNVDFADVHGPGDQINSFDVHACIPFGENPYRYVTPGAGDTGVNLRQSTVGMFVGADGLAYESAAAAIEAGTTAEAWIAYKSDTAGESLAFALTTDEMISPSNLSFVTRNSPSRDAISGGFWKWPTIESFEKMLPGLQTLSVSDDIIDVDSYLCVYWPKMCLDPSWSKYMFLSFNGVNSYIGELITSSPDIYSLRAVFAF